MRPHTLLVLSWLAACTESGPLTGPGWGGDDDTAPGDDDAGDDDAGDDDAGDDDVGDDDAGDDDAGDDDAGDDDAGDDDAGDDDAGDDDDDDAVPGSDWSACQPYGIVLGGALIGTNSSHLDAWVPGSGSYTSWNALPTTVATNATAPCSVQLQSSNIEGDLAVLGTPADVVCLSWGGSVSGQTTPLGGAIVMPTPQLPSGLPPSSGPLTLSWNAAQTWAADATYDSVVIESNASVQVTAPVTVHVLGTMTLSAANLTIADGASLDLYVAGELVLTWNASMGTAADPGRLQVSMLSASGLTLDNNAQLHGIVAAPNSGLSIASGQLFGSVWAASANVSWNGGIHVDPARVCP